MFNPSRDEARRFFFDTWAGYRAGRVLTALEQTALQVILLHPEYHPLLDAPERNLDRDYAPAQGETNPFLHLALHLAVEEQLAIDQPRGLRDAHARLIERLGDAHDAAHAVLECLGETLWQAQRLGSGPDETVYLDCLRQRAR